MNRTLVGVLLSVALLEASASGQSAVFDAYLKASNPGTEGGPPMFGFGDAFGLAVAVSGETLVVGAPWEDSAATGVDGDQFHDSLDSSGAAYVFVRTGGTWAQQAYLKASDSDSEDYFGDAVAISGDTIVVGAVGEDSASTGIDGDDGDDSAFSSGAAYVFVRSGSTWSQQAYLKASNAELGDAFGISVAISGDTIVVGASAEDSSATGVDGDGGDDAAPGSGAAYVFVRQGSTWTQQAYLKASNTDPDDHFGTSVSISGDSVVIGADDEDSGVGGVDGDPLDDSLALSGAAYVFMRQGTTWSQEAYLKAASPDLGDHFGRAVSISGDRVAIGAPGEDSALNGIDQNPINNQNNNAGAAYVFVREGSTWSQDVYLKAGDADPNDEFGGAVSMSGAVVLVGARLEDSAATGVDGDETMPGATLSGAAYVFGTEDGVWTQRALLKASNTDQSDGFGGGVALDGATALVGAPYEDGGSSGVDGDDSDNSRVGAGAAYTYDVTQILPDPWSDEGCSLAGALGAPWLVGTGTLLPGASNEVVLGNAAPDALVGLFLGLSGGAVPFKGGTLKPFPFFGPFLFSSGPTGSVSLPLVTPGSVSTGATLWMQMAIQDAGAIFGVALTNALVGTIP